MLVGANISLRPVRAADLDLLHDAHVEGMLLIIGERDEIIGHLEFDVPISCWNRFELSYLLSKTESAGHGYVTFQLLVDSQFARSNVGSSS